MRFALGSIPGVPFHLRARLAHALSRQLAEFCRAWNLNTSHVCLAEEDGQGHAVVVEFVDELPGGLGGVHDPGILRVPTIGVSTMATDSLSVGPRSLSAVISHEILETRADAACNFWSDGPPLDKVGETMYALEVCDPVQGDAYPDPATGVYLSDYVLPAWFEVGAPAWQPVDRMGVLKRPFEIRPDGYAIVRGAGPEGVTHARLGAAGWRPPVRSARRMGQPQ